MFMVWLFERGSKKGTIGKTWKVEGRYVGMRRLERLHKEGARRDRNAEAAQPLSGRGSRALDQPLPSALTDAF